jgi:hypothetical protein
MATSKLLLFLLGTSLFVLPACGTLEKGDPIDDLYSLYTDAENDGQRFSIEGYAYIGGDITTDWTGGEVNIEIYSEPLGAGDMLATLPIGFGEGKNEFYVPEEFYMEDLVLYDNEGTALAYDDKAIFSFTLDLQTERERHEVLGELRYFGLPEKVRIDKAE